MLPIILLVGFEKKRTGKVDLINTKMLENNK